MDVFAYLCTILITIIIPLNKCKANNNSNKILTNKEIEKLSNMAQKYKEILNGSTT